MTRVVLKPHVTFAAGVAPDKLAQLHDLAHRNCFVSNAVKYGRSIVEPPG